MLESLLRLENFWWAGGAFRPWPELTEDAGAVAPAAIPRGQFAFALAAEQGDRITLVRDHLGINKLFFAIHESGQVSVANYLLDLVSRGVPCEAVYSVPAGHLLRIDLKRPSLALSRYFGAAPATGGEQGSSDEIGKRIRGQLERWFARLAAQFQTRKIFVCLSGGLDSGIIAALARGYFRDVTAYTFTYAETDEHESEDARHGRRLAEFLGIPSRRVAASGPDVIQAVEKALRYGQDWRDFNVHCAIVNELLATAMAQDLAQAGGAARALVLTGDLMNEFMADYAPVVCGGREYYRLPRLDRASLRAVLVRGLDAGDREVGVFGQHGLALIQPYGLLVDLYLSLPAPLVSDEDAKRRLGRAVAGDLLPAWVFDRPKVRAQVGDSERPTGLLAALAAAGRDAQWLRQTFCRVFRIKEGAFLNKLIRAGVYRSITAFPERPGENGYLTS